jgi:hypothetical protein
MKKVSAQSPEQVVGYYNILYKLDNRDNRDNILGNEVTSLPDIDNISLSVPSGISPRGEDIPASPLGSQPGEAICSGVGNLAEEEIESLCEDQVKRAVIQFFDNGEGATQRYKFKIRLNLTDGDNPEFIATLTKDWSNFKQYIPAECKEYIMETAREFRAHIKQKYDTTPYMGKFHLNQGRQPGVDRAFTQIEPYTVAFVWYDNINSQWKYSLQIQDWVKTGDLTAAHITPAQAKIGVKVQHLYINPKYETRQRPKTWAELRAERKAAK